MNIKITRLATISNIALKVQCTVKRDTNVPGMLRWKGNVNLTNTVNFDAHWTSGAKKRRFWDFLSNRLVVQFLPP